MCQDTLGFQSGMITIIIISGINHENNNNNHDNNAVKVQGRADEEPATARALVVAEEHFQRNLNPLVIKKIRSYISNENLLRSKQ